MRKDRRTAANASLALALAGLLVGPVPAVAQLRGTAFGLETVTTGLDRPVGIVAARDGSSRLFVVEQTGRILILREGQLLSTPFLDLSSRISCCGERGLLGLAFPPSFAANGRFFVDDTDAAGNTVVSRFRVSMMDPDVADPASETVLLSVAQPFAHHNGGQLAFGPDGFLYIGLGDGGSGGDPQDNAQNLGTLLGKILRLDVDHPAPGLAYGVPVDNPFVGNPSARPEIWDFGLRNPWRFSFDRLTGALFIGDVGQSAWEEVDLEPPGSSGGRNDGWRRMEGTHCFNPSTGCEGPSLVLPILEYPHTEGCSVIGGYRYRGAAIPALAGAYVFGDFCAGTVWAALPGCGGIWHRFPLLATGFSISAFGEDAAGEIYVAQYAAATGRLHRLVAAGQVDPIFADGFETGDAGAWSACKGF